LWLKWKTISGKWKKVDKSSTDNLTNSAADTLNMGRLRQEFPLSTVALNTGIGTLDFKDAQQNMELMARGGELETQQYLLNHDLVSADQHEFEYKKFFFDFLQDLVRKKIVSWPAEKGWQLACCVSDMLFTSSDSSDTKKGKDRLFTFLDTMNSPLISPKDKKVRSKVLREFNKWLSKMPLWMRTENEAELKTFRSGLKKCVDLKNHWQLQHLQSQVSQKNSPHISG